MDNTSNLLAEIKKLSIHERMILVEQTLKSIRDQEDFKEMSSAAAELSEEYLTNTELTIFSNLDIEDFYETR